MRRSDLVCALVVGVLLMLLVILDQRAHANKNLRFRRASKLSMGL